VSARALTLEQRLFGALTRLASMSLMSHLAPRQFPLEMIAEVIRQRFGNARMAPIRLDGGSFSSACVGRPCSPRHGRTSSPRLVRNETRLSANPIPDHRGKQTAPDKRWSVHTRGTWSPPPTNECEDLERHLRALTRTYER
jgi:hypothetical protein